MAIAEIRPDWTIGTLNLTSGSTAFTTTGSMLQTAAIQAGDTIMVKGFVLVIATITGQNAGTLMEPCPAGAAGTGQPLRVRFQPDGSRYNGATADLVQLLGSGNVYEFAELQGVPDGVPVFTGAGTMEIQGKDTFVTPDPNGNLTELSSLAKQNDQFIIMGNDGSVTLRPISSKFNTPTGSIGQFLRGDGTPQSVVGTVTQAAGGAIIQRGSNANGEFVRFADGTQICWAYQTGSGVRTWTFPAAFRAGGNPNSDIIVSGAPLITVDVNNGRFFLTETITATSLLFGFLSQNNSLTGTGARLQAVGWWY